MPFKVSIDPLWLFPVSGGPPLGGRTGERSECCCSCPAFGRGCGGGLPAGKRSLHKCALRALVPERSQFLRIYQGPRRALLVRQLIQSGSRFRNVTERGELFTDRRVAGTGALRLPAASGRWTGTRLRSAQMCISPVSGHGLQVSASRPRRALPGTKRAQKHKNTKTQLRAPT